MWAAVSLSVIALLCAGSMGFAIQRGATCMVAAVDELFERRAAFRLAALGEASLWVAGGLMLARQAGWLSELPAGSSLSALTIAGGLLLGFGAWLNQACVFGSVARLGSGDWAYAATPFGFYLGLLILRALPLDIVPATAGLAMPLVSLPAWLGFVLVPFALWRFAGAVRAAGRTIWRPHEATVVIGISFTILLLLAGPWAYTELLADLARGNARNLDSRLALFLALFAGAILGGWRAGLLRRRPLRVPKLARTLAGGMLMGWGSALIPGGNDSLILVGIPLLQPHAWVGIASMCTAIALAFLVQRRIGPRPHPE